MAKVDLYFEKLIELIDKENRVFAFELLNFCHKKDKEKLNLFSQILQNRNIFIDVFEKLVQAEITSSHDVFLRGDTIATKMLRLNQDFHARQYYSQILKKPIDSLTRLKLNLEILNSAESEEAEMVKLAKKVSRQFTKLFSEICSIPVPPLTAITCYCIAKVIKESKTTQLIKAFDNNGAEQLAVGLTLFLYTICPIFISDFADISNLGYRNSVLMAKILLALASGTNFDQAQYKYFSIILDQNRINYSNFAVNIINSAEEMKSMFIPSSPTPFSLWKKFYTFLKENENELLQECGNVRIGESSIREQYRIAMSDVERKKAEFPIKVTTPKKTVAVVDRLSNRANSTSVIEEKEKKIIRKMSSNKKVVKSQSENEKKISNKKVVKSQSENDAKKNTLAGLYRF